MDAMETAKQIAALEGFAIDNADLERLKGVLIETDAATLKALQNFANFCSGSADLEQLRQALAEKKTATLKALRNFESLAANNPEFEKLKELHREWSAEFDAIAFLKRSRDESFHSRFLAWLLDPKENHGTGTYFLENFLRKNPRTGEKILA